MEPLTHEELKQAEVILGCTEPLGIWNFYRNEAEAEADKGRANASSTTCEYRVMTYTEYKAREREVMLQDGLQDITEDRFNEMLEVLPPMGWRMRDGVNSFFMSEMMSGSYTQMYAAYGGKHFCKMVDLKDQATWITRKEIEEYVNKQNNSRT